MTHRNNFVAVIKCGGAILREHDGVVTLPFGSEYSVLLKNLDARKASVGISIDGQSATEGRELVVYPNTTAELEGFMQRTLVRNRFKFVQKTREIVEHRGDQIDDGIVRVKFMFEKEVTEDVTYHYHTHYTHYEPWYPLPHPWYPTMYPTITYNNTGGCSASDISKYSVTGCGFSTNVSAGATAIDVRRSDAHVNCCVYATPEISPNEGITVRGAETYQSFTPVQLGQMEDTSTVITIRLVGTDAVGATVETPVTVQDKFRCPTCGKVSKSDVTYCSRCGTNLTRQRIFSMDTQWSIG